MSDLRAVVKKPIDNLVVAMTDHDLDKYSLLEKVLREADFFGVLSEHQKQSGIKQKDFKIVIKPNITMLLRRSDVGIYTDPFLAIHLLRLLRQKGYENLAVVESQNLYGNWFENRGVVQIATRAGYFDETETDFSRARDREMVRVRGGGVDASVPLIDLTLERAPHDFGEPVGKIELGKTWMEADFRINFAKMKTHFYSDYSLAIKNIYGCLPLQDKVRGYHCRRVVGKWTALVIRDFPVHFSIVDGYSAADGWLGVKIKAVARKPHTLLAGADIQAVDHFGARLLKLEPEKSIMYRELMSLTPPASYRVVGDHQPVKPWRNSPHLLALFCQVIEANANIMDFSGSLATGGYDPCFPHESSNQGPLKRLLYYLSLPMNFFSDLGFAKLRWKEYLVSKKIRKYRNQLPVISGSEYLCKRLTFFGPEDLEFLIKVLEPGIPEEISFSGHYLFLDGREIPFPARLSTTNLAVVEMLRHLQPQRLEKRGLLDELRLIKRLFAELPGSESGYPYCFC